MAGFRKRRKIGLTGPRTAARVSVRRFRKRVAKGRRIRR